MLRNAQEEVCIPRLPEEQLLAGVLGRAIKDYLGEDRWEAQDAEAWLKDREPATGDRFTFVHVCTLLDLDVEVVWDRIQKLKEENRYVWQRGRGVEVCAGALSACAGAELGGSSAGRCSLDKNL